MALILKILFLSYTSALTFLLKYCSWSDLDFQRSRLLLANQLAIRRLFPRHVLLYSYNTQSTRVAIPITKYSIVSECQTSVRDPYSILNTIYSFFFSIIFMSLEVFLFAYVACRWFRTRFFADKVPILSCSQMWNNGKNEKDMIWNILFE